MHLKKNCCDGLWVKSLFLYTACLDDSEDSMVWMLGLHLASTASNSQMTWRLWIWPRYLAALSLPYERLQQGKHIKIRRGKVSLLIWSADHIAVIVQHPLRLVDVLHIQLSWIQATTSPLCPNIAARPVCCCDLKHYQWKEKKPFWRVFVKNVTTATNAITRLAFIYSELM